MKLASNINNFKNQTVTFKIFNLPEDPSDSADYSINYDFYVNSEHGFNLISSYEDSEFTYENPVYGLEIQIPELFNYMDESFYTSFAISQGEALTSFPNNDLLDVDIVDNMGEYNYNTIGIQPCSLTGGFPNIYPTSCSEGSNPGTYYYSCVDGEIQDIQDNCNNNVGGVLPGSVSFGSFCLMNTSVECDCDPTEIEEIPEELEDLCYISQITPTPDFPYGQSHVGYITFNSTASDGSGEFLVGKKFPIGDVNQQSLTGTAEKFTFKLFTGVEPIEFATYAGGHDITLTYSNSNYDEAGVMIDLVVGGRITVTRDGIDDDLSFYLPKMSNYSDIFIHRASTRHHSLMTIESIVNHLQRGNIPQILLESKTDNEINKFFDFVRRSKFTLINIAESPENKVNQHQNGAAWIKIEPLDIFIGNDVKNYL